MSGGQDNVVTNPSARLQAEMYRELRNRGVYVNQPDTYFFQVKSKKYICILHKSVYSLMFQGGNKASMGYNEGQFTLPRWEDLSISRQTVFDATWTR